MSGSVPGTVLGDRYGGNPLGAAALLFGEQTDQSPVSHRPVGNDIVLHHALVIYIPQEFEG